MTENDRPDRLLTPQDVTDLISHWLKVAGPPPTRETTAGITGRLLTAREVGELLGFSPSTIIDWWEQESSLATASAAVFAFVRTSSQEWLELDARDIALHFGHQDGGELVRKLCGHPDAALARERVREAFRQAPAAPIPLAATAS